MIREPVMRALSEERGERESPLRDYLSALRRRWWVVGLVFVAVVAIAMLHTSRQQRLYRATATVRIEETYARLAGMPTAMPRVDYRFDPMQSEQRVIRSQEIGQRVADSLGLRLRPPEKVQWTRIFGAEPVIVRHAPETYADYHLRFGDTQYVLVENGRQLASARYGDRVDTPWIALTVPERPELDARAIALQVIPQAPAGSMVQGSIMTRSVPQTNIMEISYTSNDALLAQIVANAIAEKYRQFSKERRSMAASRQTAFIRQSLDAQQLRLAAAQDSLRLFKQREDVSNVQAAQQALFLSIGKFESERDVALVEQGVYRALLGELTAADTATAELRKLAATEAVQANAYMKSLYDQWFAQTKAREELMATTGRLPHDPDVQAIDRLIADIKQQIQAGSGHYLQALQSRISSLATRIAELRAQLARYTPLEQQEAKLLTDVQIVQNTYEQLQSAYQQARIAENDESGYVEVIDQAQRPYAPVSPDRQRIFITAVLVGLLLGVGAAVLLDNLDDSVRSPDEIRAGMGLPVLGTIPRIRDTRAARRGVGVINSRLVTQLDPRSPVAEAYRSLRTNLAFARPSAPLRTVVFTSPGPADGKSTTVANLAITLAQQGQRTLIIDADLRRAVLDKMFGAPRSPGLTDLLIGRAAMEDVIRSTEIENLFVLPSGAFPPNPSELLGSAAMRQVLEAAGARFDIVLLDSPPLLAVTDAAVLSTVADGTLLVVRTGETSRAAVRRALGQLVAVQGRLVGAVLNDVDMSESGYGGGYGYYYYYHYTADAENGHHAGVGTRLLRWARGGAWEK